MKFILTTQSLFLSSLLLFSGCGGTGSSGGEKSDIYESSIPISSSNEPVIQDETVTKQDDEEFLNGININDGGYFLGYTPPTFPSGAFYSTVCEQWTPYRYYYKNGDSGCASINGQIEGKSCHIHVIDVNNELFKINTLTMSIAEKYGTSKLILGDEQLYELYTNDNNMAELFISPYDTNSTSYFDFIITCEEYISVS